MARAAAGAVRSAAPSSETAGGEGTAAALSVSRYHADGLVRFGGIVRAAVVSVTAEVAIVLGTQLVLAREKESDTAVCP